MYVRRPLVQLNLVCYDFQLVRLLLSELAQAARIANMAVMTPLRVRSSFIFRIVTHGSHGLYRHPRSSNVLLALAELKHGLIRRSLRLVYLLSSLV